jgi:hypothetical protein
MVIRVLLVLLEIMVYLVSSERLVCLEVLAEEDLKEHLAMKACQERLDFLERKAMMETLENLVLLVLLVIQVQKVELEILVYLESGET